MSNIAAVLKAPPTRQARIRILIGLGLLAALAAPRVGQADDKAAARERYRAGERSYKVGDFHEALAAFKAAYQFSPDPTLLYNIAQCYRQLGETKTALFTYRNYLRERPDAPNRTEVEARIADLERQAAAGAPGPAPPPAHAPPAPSVPPARPPAPRAQPDLALSAAPAPAPEEAPAPLMKRWWFWAVAGAVVAGGVTAVLLTRTRTGVPDAPLGNQKVLP